MVVKTLQAELSIYMECLKMKIKEINCETGEEILRDATDLELQQAETDKASAEAELETLVAQAQAKAAEKAALLDRLGITEDEAKLLLA